MSFAFSPFPIPRMISKVSRTASLKPPSHPDKDYKDRNVLLKLDKRRENGMKCSKNTQFLSWFYVFTKLLQGCHGV